MKRLLFCAGVLALAASCTEDLDTLSVQQEQTKGITFTAMDAENATTKGEFEETGEGESLQWLPFWSAETDMIDVFATKVVKGGSSFGNAMSDANYAVYKATRSERNAYFTAANQIDILNFAAEVDEENPATFLAVYPSGEVWKSTGSLTATEKTCFEIGSVTPDWENGFDVTLTATYPLANEQWQENTKGKGTYRYNGKFAVAKGYPEADNKVAVGENVPLKFQRILTGLVFKTKGIDAYTKPENSIFGKLQSITVNTLGEYKDGEAVAGGKVASKLNYDANSNFTVTVNPDGTTTLKDFEAIETSATNTMTVKFAAYAGAGLGLDWNDDARAYMIIKPIDRTVDGEAWTEGVTVTYTFDNIVFTKLYETSSTWEATKFIPVPALDMADYPWLVTETSGYENSGLTLILNEGADFSKVYNKTGETVNWKWGTSNTTVDAANITRIISNIDLTDEQLQIIGEKFTGLKEIEYNVETSIPAGAFKAQADQITNLIMPKVTKIDAKFTNNGTANQALSALEVLNLESYTFPSTEINYLLFDGMENASNSKLEELNMKAVKDMTANFNENRTLSFEGFNALKSVEMGENVIVAQKAFKNCSALRSVTGTLDLNTANAVEAFYAAGGNATYDAENPEASFNTINLTSDEIPAWAFHAARGIYHLLKDGKQIVPTYIGTSAFQGAHSLEYMDLSKAAVIGENAFWDAKEYVGVSGSKRLDVAAKTLESGILAGTKVVNVYFAEAVTVNGAIFYNYNSLSDTKFSADNLQQVEFAKTFTAKKDGVFTNAFGKNAANVELFIKEGQLYYNRDKAQELALPGSTITFKSIKVGTANAN